MAENTKIEWADHTFNPWEGCTKIGPGCDHCYAETRNARFGGGNWGPGAPRRRTSPANWHNPRRWNQQAAKNGTRYRVFCASLADVFDNEVPSKWRADLFDLIRETPHLDWLLLTKRVGNVGDMVPSDFSPLTFPNVWLGITVVTQQEAERDIPKLLNVDAALHWLSMEPLLEPVDISEYLPGDRWMHSDEPMLAPVQWVIVGGESGPGARPMHPAWARALRDQCASANVPFLFKQWGDWAPALAGELYFHPMAGCSDFTPRAAGNDTHTFLGMFGAGAVRIGKKKAGRLLDDRQWDGFPTGLVLETEQGGSAHE